MPYFVDRCPILVDPNFQNGSQHGLIDMTAFLDAASPCKRMALNSWETHSKKVWQLTAYFFSSGVAALSMLSLHMASCIIMSLIGGVAPFERIYIYRYVIMFFVNIDFNIYISIQCVLVVVRSTSRAMLIISPCTTGRCIAVCPLKEVPIEKRKIDILSVYRI